ncbi:MAG: 6-phosphogluconolactonase [Peptostreptococcaceae bacterium]|nr:6-phosphogluconolactonase [Peptostreptococcaceae bacterium]
MADKSQNLLLVFVFIFLVFPGLVFSKLVTREIGKTVAVDTLQYHWQIQNKNKSGKPCVLRLATGASPKSLYKELVRMHKEEGLSFKNTITFNLDEHYPIKGNNIRNNSHFMYEYLFDHIDIPKENINLPDGSLLEEKVDEFCQDYEKKIKSLGGIDIQLLGIGLAGHIGFNEPGSDIDSPTRLVTLDSLTVASTTTTDLNNKEQQTLHRAITMGVGTIMSSHRIFMMALGENKAEIIRKMIDGPITENVPVTFLQNHPNTEVIINNLVKLDTN